jgi:1-deoxy-D-xylulose-5-phosphate synthase
MTILTKDLLPNRLKTLDGTQMELLAQEIRETIITTVSKTGGHLASSLGVVEIALSLHRVFDTPQDRIIWDVGLSVILTN